MVLANRGASPSGSRDQLPVEAVQKLEHRQCSSIASIWCQFWYWDVTFDIQTDCDCDHNM
jgi:hypothetical protein